MTTALLPLLLLAVDDPAAIMARMAANVESASDARRQYVYRQLVRSNFVRGSGELARRERREYSVFPTVTATEKKLEVFSGEYRKGKAMVPYSDPKFRSKDLDLDGDLIDELTDDLVADKNARDGIPHSLFPLRTRDLSSYQFKLLGETVWKGRKVHRIGFEPAAKGGSCIHIGGDSEGDGCDTPWRGEAWVDAEELQPVRIDTNLAVKVPWAIRAFLGTNLKQTGFSITYTRLEPNVWFPATYGTEFKLNVLFGYKRTITLALESTEFRKTAAQASIQYEMPKEP